jgi:rubrerythrin
MRVAKAAAAVEGEDEEKGYALGEAPPATRSGTSLYIRPQDRPTMPKKQKERKIDISTAPQFAGMPQGAEKSVEVEKAMKAASMPRIPRALMNDTYRSATAVLTRNHSAIAKDVSALHTGPLTDEGIKELQEEEYNRTKRMPVYKSCEGCGRTFMVKSMNDPCPTCSVNKSHYCSKCHQHLVKSGNGSVTCPLCG